MEYTIYEIKFFWQSPEQEGSFITSAGSIRECVELAQAETTNMNAEITSYKVLHDRCGKVSGYSINGAKSNGK